MNILGSSSGKSHGRDLLNVNFRSKYIGFEGVIITYNRAGKNKEVNYLII